jgi:hypothetical protein
MLVHLTTVRFDVNLLLHWHSYSTRKPRNYEINIGPPLWATKVAPTLNLCPVKSLLPSLFQREELPLFGKWFDEAHHPELVEGEGRGKIF